MTPPPGIHFAVAPYFHIDIDWPGRLSLAAGVELTGEGPVTRPPWRPAGADELAALVLDPTQPGAREELPRCVCLFAVPAHLRAAFWDVVARGEEQGQIPADDFSAFADEVARFLAFKQMPLPVGAVFELLVSRPGQTAAPATSSGWGLINLGEEAVSVVFLSPPARDGSAPDHPPVRLQLAPGEGARIPAGLLLGSDDQEREQAEVLLLIRLPDTG
jgi:hypothetical protein